jgi:hypothetical protein
MQRYNIFLDFWNIMIGFPCKRTKLRNPFHDKEGIILYISLLLGIVKTLWRSAGVLPFILTVSCQIMMYGSIAKHYTGI